MKNSISNDNKAVDLFWSGGWDSTFRLLQLLLLDNKKVQPHYMVWGGDAIGETIEAMQEIRAKLYSVYPEVKKMLLPINFFDAQSITPNERIANAFTTLEKTCRVGGQHLKLAQFCDQNNIEEAEQGTLENDNRNLNLIRYISEFKIDKEKSSKEIYELFKYFKFPLIDYGKKDMDDVVKEQGWGDIMYLTWFCRRPINGRPCRFCGNCTDTVINGMGKRLPVRARIVAYAQLPFRKWWRANYQKQSTGIYKNVKELLKHRA